MEIQIQSLSDPQSPMSAEFTAKGQLLQLEGAVIIEGATNGGRTGVMLTFEDPLTKKKYMALTTARIIANGLAAAVRGACDRFNDDLNQA